MEDLSFTHLDHESIVSLDDLDAIVESHARVTPPPAYRAASVLDGLGAYATVFPAPRPEVAAMPYLQLDTPFAHPVEVKQRLAKRFGEIYAEVMAADVNRISIAIRELGEGGIWRCGPDDPRPAAILMCDIRRGRTAENRAELARRLVAACIEILGLREDNLNVEFTQHAGDEMYHTMYGGLSQDWTPDTPDRLREPG